MTLTYLLAFFYTPAVFRFQIPILGIQFMTLVKYGWSCEFMK